MPYFCALFCRRKSYASIDCLIRQRLQGARRIPDTTDAFIAAEVGYEDAYYFTRCFRRIVGCPPRSYRRIPEG